ncbi:hypothetical protein DFH06DRAFT_1200262 [Mycena polygramma]|nr:hypothetical protein DFH06DRAFT_1200262 [Mycena polygramma]
MLAGFAALLLASEGGMHIPTGAAAFAVTTTLRLKFRKAPRLSRVSALVLPAALPAVFTPAVGGLTSPYAPVLSMHGVCLRRYDGGATRRPEILFEPAQARPTRSSSILTSSSCFRPRRRRITAGRTPPSNPARHLQHRRHRLARLRHTIAHVDIEHNATQCVTPEQRRGSLLVRPCRAPSALLSASCMGSKLRGAHYFCLDCVASGRASERELRCDACVDPHFG